MGDMVKKMIKTKELHARCSNWVESQMIMVPTEEDPLAILNLDESEDTVSNSEFDSVSQCGAKKRRLGTKLKDEQLNLRCEWKNCTLETSKEKVFLDHMSSHIPELELKIFENNTATYVCGWKNCPYETSLTTEITWHIYYHSYHQKLKSIGYNFKQRNKLTQCLRETDWSNMELPPTLICQWDDCLETFNKYQTFLDHVTIHIEKYPRGNKVEGGIQCKWSGCKNNFPSIHKLKDHMRSHTKEKTIACPDCGLMVSTNSKFREHCDRQISVETQGFLCSFCNKFYPTEKILQGHVRQHFYSKKCNLCDMICESPATLAKHIRYRHLDERAFACQLCKHTAKTQQDLDYHMSVHTKGPMFRCSVDGCAYQCKNAYVLDRHVEKIHCQETRWYCCHECPVKYQKSYRLTRHLIDVHHISLNIGHKRFQYQRCVDGCYRVQTTRFEFCKDNEVTTLADKSVKTNDVVSNSNILDKNYTLKITQAEDICVEVVETQDKLKDEDLEIEGNLEIDEGETHGMGKSMPIISNILISIDEMDADGNIIRSKIVETQETSVLPHSEEPPIILT